MVLLTTKEAAIRLGIRSTSVVRAIQRGKLKAQKRGRDYFIEEQEIDRYGKEYGRKASQ
jgi:excisionase family DNA binding protein